MLDSGYCVCGHDRDDHWEGPDTECSVEHCDCEAYSDEQLGDDPGDERRDRAVEGYE